MQFLVHGRHLCDSVPVAALQQFGVDLFLKALLHNTVLGPALSLLFDGVQVRVVDAGSLIAGRLEILRFLAESVASTKSGGLRGLLLNRAELSDALLSVRLESLSSLRLHVRALIFRG